MKGLPGSWKGVRMRGCPVSAYVSGTLATRVRPKPPVAGVGPVTSPAGSSGHQVFANYLAWSNLPESSFPWGDMTQVAMFALLTENGTGLNTTMNGVNKYNLPSWTSVVHQHGEDALIAIGGSNDENWANACDATNQAGFVSNLVNYIVSNGFDGVDIDAEGGVGSAAEFEGCVQAISTAAHAVRTEQGRTPIVAEEMDESLYSTPPYSTIQVDYPFLDQVQLEYFGFDPTNDWNCGMGSPADTCAYVTQMVDHALNQGIPASKLLLGMYPGGGAAQCCYSNLAATSASVDTGGSVASIPLASGLGSALPAGNVVLASTENPPAHYEVFTTSGAAAGATSIPITGVVHGNGSFVFPSGSDVQSAYMGPWDCYNMGQYAAAHGMKGNMIFALQTDAGGHNGQFPCEDQLALGLGL